MAIHQLKYVFSYSKPTWTFVLGVKKLVLTYGAILGVNYLVVFILLVGVYYKVWTYIRLIRRLHGECNYFRISSIVQY